MAEGLARSPCAQGLGLAARRPDEVLEEAIDLLQVARFDPDVEIGLPVADLDAARRVQGRLHEAEGRPLEPDPSVDDRERATPRDGNPEPAFHERSGRAGLDSDRAAPVRLPDTALAPPKSHAESRGARQARTGQVEVSQETLDRDPIRLEGESEDLRPGDEIADSKSALRPAALVRRLFDIGHQLLPVGRHRGRDVFEREAVRVDRPGGELAGNPKLPARRDLDAGAQVSPAAEAEPGPEQPLDFLDRKPRAHVEVQARAGKILDRARAADLPEVSCQRELVERHAALRVDSHPRCEREDDGFGPRQLDSAPPRDDPALQAVLPRHRELDQKILETAVDRDLPAGKVEDAFLDQDVVQVHLDAAAGLRPGQARQVPRPVGKLRERDPRPQRADTPEAQLRSDQRDAAANRDLLGREKRAAAGPRVVSNDDIQQAHRRRKNTEVRGAEGDRPLQRLRQARL